ncbi:MAG: tRNA (adenosine(37)-N6)-threonylcarbamoyltransferase complex dimerization subunit type 1 TsaB [Xanthobacteraceae bacterium]|nr:MAG: tRNA (adenosine(37)-N6)-threonylcarbamoyltransferase complex dimerization subunit type 1 TsaB [Xanthobacteraceae bacterium]
MLILAIDTALEACSAAVLDTAAAGDGFAGDGAAVEIDCERTLIASETLPMKRGHAEALMPLIARVMERAQTNFAALDRIAVTVGPGSFTGLRVGIAAARGLALAAARPAVGITTLAALAAPLAAEGGPDPIVAAIDARHGQVYFQVLGGNGTTLIRPRIGPIEEATRAARFGTPRLIGNAAPLLAAAWPAQAPAPLDIDPRPAPDIAWVAWLGAATRTDQDSARPLYLRPPDARPAAGAALPRR